MVCINLSHDVQDLIIKPTSEMPSRLVTGHQLFFFNQKNIIYKCLYLPVWMSFHRTQDLDWSSKITKQRCLCLSICGKHKSRKVLITLHRHNLSGDYSTIKGCTNVRPLQGTSQHLQTLIWGKKKVSEYHIQRQRYKTVYLLACMRKRTTIPKSTVNYIKIKATYKTIDLRCWL